MLRRTKLGETDLIVTLLCDQIPTQVRAVAKGARRPGARLAGVVDLGNEVSLLLHPGRSLDVIGEGKLMTSRAGFAADPDRSALAAVILDAAAELTAEGQHDPRLYPLTSSALDTLGNISVGQAPLLTAAYIFKAAAMQGYRPALTSCVRCGASHDPLSAAADGGQALFSFEEGGIVCSACADVDSSTTVDAALLAWIQTLLGMRFAEFTERADQPSDDRLGYDALRFAQTWLAHYPGVHVRALDFVLSGLAY